MVANINGTPVLLSGSTNGKPIAVAATGSPGTLIHQVPKSSDGTYFHQVVLWAKNQNVASKTLTLQLGDTATSSAITVTIAGSSSPVLVLNGDNLFNNACTIRAHADTANDIILWGYAVAVTGLIKQS